MATADLVSNAQTRETLFSAASGVEPTPAHSRIDYLDGLRGLAALAITIMHTFEIFGMGVHPVGVISDGLLGHSIPERVFEFFYSHVVQHANYAVEVFIVISGYSLMLAVAKSSDGQPKGGLKGYFVRRIRRIWPPYYAALAISLLVILFVPGMNEKHNVWWDLALPALTPQTILSHVFFAQSLTPDWFFKINPPMWTVAVEEQIYVLFPLLLLPIWRRFGSKGMVATAAVVGISTWFICRPYIANPWYLGLFALGALGASAGFSRREGEKTLLARFPWAKAGLVVFGIFFVLNEINARVDLGLGDISFILDTMLGAAVTCLLVVLTERWKRGDNRRFSALRLLQAPPVVGLGRFSYSLYLMHAPLLAMMALLVLNSGIRSLAAYAIMLFIALPLAVFGTYLFHRVFERPFMPTSVATGKAPAVVETARVS